jgi:hypothetical protein
VYFGRGQRFAQPLPIDSNLNAGCIHGLSRHLQILGRPECDFLACFDFDRFAGCGIAPHAGCAIFDL